MDTFNPDYYRIRPLESIEIMELMEGTEAVMHFCMCNVYKYLYRRGQKNTEVEDLKKARWYLDKYIAYLEEGDRIEVVREKSDEDTNQIKKKIKLNDLNFEEVDPDTDQTVEAPTNCQIKKKLGKSMCESNCVMPCEEEE